MAFVIEYNWQLQLLLRKGMFPYELLTSLEKFRKMVTFPPKELFYSGLYEKHALQADHEHGKRVKYVNILSIGAHNFEIFFR